MSWRSVLRGAARLGGAVPRRSYTPEAVIARATETRPPGHDYGYEAFQAARAHLDSIEEWDEYWSEEGLKPEGPEPDMAAPWDGCTDCIVRETLHAAWPIIAMAIRSGDFD